MDEIDTAAIRTQLRKHGDLPKLTCADMADEIDRLRARLAAVEALHYPRGRNIHGDEVCAECSPLRPMPCQTLRAAQGEGDRV